MWDEFTCRYTPGKTILSRVNLSAGSDSRICIVSLNKDAFVLVIISYHKPSFIFKVGENGAGKTTLLKILTGELNPSSGMRHNSRHLRIGYFSQHHVDQLDLSLCPVELLQTKFPGE